MGRVDGCAEIVPLHLCGSCRETVGESLTMRVPDDETIRVFSCDSCLEKVSETLSKVRPIFLCMIECGVPREVADDAMTFLLDRMDRSEI